MISIVDYGAGNLTSVKRALDYIGIQCSITSNPLQVEIADRIIFPGVGNALSCVKTLRERKLDAALINAFKSGTPILGICLGTQIILEYSDEGNTDCLGIIPGKCRQFRFKDTDLKIPHMGWNSITIQKTHPVLSGIKTGSEFYFVHSFYPDPQDKPDVFATCDYGINFASAIGRKNIFAVQFHPEKSGKTGLTLLENFARWDGKNA